MSYLSMPTALATHERVVNQFTALLRTSPHDDRKVPHLSWSIGETGAHVLSMLRLYPDPLAGGPPFWTSLTAGDAENARRIAEIRERDPGELADAIDVAAPKFREAFATYDEELAPWHAGLRVPSAAIVGIQAGDTLIHGWDIARALGRRWEIDPADACLSISAVAPVAAYFVDEEEARGLTATYGIRLRGGPEFTFTFADGSLTTVEGRPPHADCRMSVEPAAYLLAGYGRVPVWRSAIRGRLASYGRRPWLGLKFTSLLRNP
jgi:uncharacterized protein (TIGR03083 family)